jgi:hypothetical protein
MHVAIMEDRFLAIFGEMVWTEELEDLGINGKIILKLIFNKLGWRVWTGLIWLRIETSADLLWTQ